MKKGKDVAGLYKDSGLKDVPDSEIRFMCLALIHENKKLRTLIDGKWDKLNWRKLAKGLS